VLGQRLAAKRKDMGLTQGDVATRTGLTQGQVSNVEKGEVDARMSTWMRMAHVLELDVDIPLPND
jgi:predicted transcriptional regulator